MEALTSQIEGLRTSQQQQCAMSAVICDFCGGGHPNHECQAGNHFASSSMTEQADFVNNFCRPNYPYSDTYNPGWRNGSIAGCNEARAPQQNQPPLGFYPPQEEKSNLEDLMTRFVTATETRFQNQEASIRKLETHIGQLADFVSGRQQGTLPSNIEKNPKEQVQAIPLRSEKELAGPSQKAEEELEKAASQPDKVVDESWKKKERENMTAEKTCNEEEMELEADDEVTARQKEEEPNSSELSTEGVPKLELKLLPSHLKNAFLDCNSHPVIVSYFLSGYKDHGDDSTLILKKGNYHLREIAGKGSCTFPWQTH